MLGFRRRTDVMRMGNIKQHHCSTLVHRCVLFSLLFLTMRLLCYIHKPSHPHPILLPTLRLFLCCSLQW